MIGSDVPRFGLNLHTSIGEVDPVHVARHAEQLGFDLVSVHRDVIAGPPPSYEMWTLLTWLAANTSSITLTSNVLAMPNRHPALLAKMAASLDALARHRLILTLGAGAPINHDAVRSIGLPTPSGAAAVTALGEQIHMLRTWWSGQPVTRRGALGEFRDAAVFPHPNQSIPIWIGGYGPRMLRLIGERADGWLPSGFILPPDQLDASIARVHRAAHDAARDPEEITVGYNIGVLIGSPNDRRPGQLSGTVDHVAAALADLARRGVNLINLWPADTSDAHRDLVATAVLPQVKDRLS
jgi:alkanesulfonate monooxygenase SsuD/methylene tetrahydromethanopterin reductase-like flavin-dependent oxidoreductase (luciferase family)